MAFCCRPSSSGANPVIDLRTFSGSSAGSANLSSSLDDALTGRPLSKEHEERGKEDGSDGTMWRGSDGGTEP